MICINSIKVQPRPKLKSSPAAEKIYVNFDGADVFSSSWEYEFLTALYRKSGDSLIFKKSADIPVNAGIDLPGLF